MMNDNQQHSNNSHNNKESTVIRVVVDQPLYAVTLDNYYQLFSRCGKVSRIVTFHKNGSMQALIQFADPESALIARSSLDGTSMFGVNSHNVLRVSASKLTHLNVKYNNDKSRDYTLTASSLMMPPHNNSSNSNSSDASLQAAIAAAAAAATASDIHHNSNSHHHHHHQMNSITTSAAGNSFTLSSLFD